MSTNKLSHLKEWEKIYLEVTREISTSDDSMGLMFCWTSSYTTFVNDDDTFYTLEELKQLANDGMPKQGDEIEVRTYSTEKEWEIKTVSHTALITTDGKPYALGQWRYQPKKTELTLAEVEERLGLEKGSLIIKD